MKRLVWCLLALAAPLSTVSLAQAADVNCDITGTIKYEPVDLYYCDKDHQTTGQTCDAWNYKNLDDMRQANGTAAPLQYLKITAHELLADGTEKLLGTGFTDATGKYTVKFKRPTTCTGKVVRFREEFARVHEDDLNKPTPRFRFRIVDEAQCIANPGTPCKFKNWRTNFKNVTLTGTSTARNVVHTEGTTNVDHFLAVYYTANAAVSEMKNWSPQINYAFSGPTLATQTPIVVDPDYTSTSKTTSEAVWIDFTSYRAGATIRHELGHWAHAGQLPNQLSSCLSYAYGGDTSGGHRMDSCEFGSAMSVEAIADFYAVRSATSDDQNAWWCQAKTIEGGGQFVCSDVVKDLVGDPEKDGYGGFFLVLGDMVANSSAKCVVPGQFCGASPDLSKVGFRMEANLARFFWDMIDTSNDGGQDTVDLDIGGFAAVVEGFPCANVFSNADGSCNEASVAPSGTCTDARRDLYNATDFSQAFAARVGRAAGVLTPEARLNCVAAAPDN